MYDKYHTFSKLPKIHINKYQEIIYIFSVWTENGGVPWSMAYAPSEQTGISK